MNIALLVLAATATALATGLGVIRLGVIPVFLLGRRSAALRPVLLGTTVGLMTVASIVGLLRPAIQEGGPLSVLGGLAVGVAFLVVAGAIVDRPRMHDGHLPVPTSGCPCSFSPSSSSTASRRDSRSAPPTPRTVPASACS